ncbi:hypothetical protein M0804_008147 [Polistes exclamans]|nr:hypothetical protein M0804_008147 [Polistes exclamans]
MSTIHDETENTTMPILAALCDIKGLRICRSNRTSTRRKCSVLRVKALFASRQTLAPVVSSVYLMRKIYSLGKE